MKLTYAIFLNLLVCLLGFCQAIGYENAKAIEEDLRKFNATCNSDRICEKCSGCDDDSMFAQINCQCEASCVRLGKCCASSQYLQGTAPQIKPSCRLILSEDVGGLFSGVWMIDRCPPSEVRSAYDELCRQEDNDLMRMVPVTSLFSRLTYKNIFCYLCHESNDDYMMWNVDVGYYGQSDVALGDPNMHVIFDDYNHTWVAPLGEDGKYVPVKLEYKPPDTIDFFAMIRYCKLSLISECATDWTDEDVRMKCQAYIQEAVFKRDGRTRMYKNQHCALCNHEDLGKRICIGSSTGYEETKKKRPFSFTFLLDINQSDGDKVGKIQRCTSRQIWDPFYKKCRNLKCAIPGYIVLNGKCAKA